MKTYKRRTRTRTNKHNKKNIARGPKQFFSKTSLGKKIRLPPIRQSQKLRQSSKRKNSSKHVQINTPENELYEYSLNSSERQWKKLTPVRGIPRCRNPESYEDFPCKLKRTVFNNLREYNKYLDLKEDRNYSTGYKSKTEHYNNIESMLMWKGTDLSRK